MTTPAINKVPAEALAETAETAVQEIKAVVDTMLDTTNRFTETTKGVMAAQQEFLHSSLEMWQRYNQVYADFAIKATQQMFDQSLALREEMSKIVESDLKKAQELVTVEEEVMFEAAEAFRAQVQATSERIAKMFSPISLN